MIRGSRASARTAAARYCPAETTDTLSWRRRRRKTTESGLVCLRVALIPWLPPAFALLRNVGKR